MKMISGTEYYRRLRRMSRLEMAKRMGVSRYVVTRILRERTAENLSLQHLVSAAAVLDVKLDELLIPRDEEELDGGGYIPPSGSGNPRNCIAVYRREKSLSLQSLGQRLGGLSREWARQVCAAEKPSPRYVALLAEREGITSEEFRQKYAAMGGKEV